MSTQSFTPAFHFTPRRRRYGALTRMRTAGQRAIRTRLQGLLRSLPEDVAEVRDEQEHVDRHLEREMDFTLLAMQSHTLRGIDQALERFHRGEDTECVECGERIAAPRLRALPFATRCCPCQEQLEAAFAG